MSPEAFVVCGAIFESSLEISLSVTVYLCARPSSACSGFCRRPAPSPCVHALLLESMLTRQAQRSPTKTLEQVQVSSLRIIASFFLNHLGACLSYQVLPVHIFHITSPTLN